MQNTASPVAARDGRGKLGGSAKVGTVAIMCGHANRKTAAATAQVQRPAGSPSAAAVMDVLPMMRLLV